MSHSKKKGLRSLFRHVSQSKYHERSPSLEKAATSSGKEAHLVETPSPSSYRKCGNNTNEVQLPKICSVTHPSWNIEFTDTQVSTRSSSLSEIGSHGAETLKFISDYYSPIECEGANSSTSVLGSSYVVPSTDIVMPASVVTPGSRIDSLNTTVSSTEDRYQYCQSTEHLFQSNEAMILEPCIRRQRTNSSNVFDAYDNKLSNDEEVDNVTNHPSDKIVNINNVAKSNNSELVTLTSIPKVASKPTTIVSATSSPISLSQPSPSMLLSTTNQAATIDIVLTNNKLQQLHHDVKRIESAIRHNFNEQKDLNDRLIEQLAVAPKSKADTELAIPYDCPTISSEAEIKRVYSEKSKSLKQQSKALKERLEATEYVISHLESNGIPIGVSPKDYVKQLLQNRHKPSNSSPIFKPKISVNNPSSTNETNQLIATSASKVKNTSTSKYQYSHTLPTRMSNSFNELIQATNRQTNTMPAGTESRPKRGISHSNSLHSLTRLESNVTPNSGLIGRLDIIGSANSKSIGNESVSMSKYTASPSNEHIPSHSKGSQKSQGSGAVLKSVRSGFESLTRHIWGVHKNRSVSDDGLPSPTNGTAPRHKSSLLHIISDKRRPKKSVSNANSRQLHPPDVNSTKVSDSITTKSQPIRTNSFCSANGMSGHMPSIGSDIGGRGLFCGGASGLSFNKEEVNYSWSDSEHNLARIFECLGFSGNIIQTSQNLTDTVGITGLVGGVASSSSSALSTTGVIPMEASKTGSKSQISVAIPNQIDVNNTQPLLTSSFTVVPPNKLALAFTLLHRQYESQLTALYQQQMHSFQELHEELNIMRNETLNIQTTLSNLTTELEAIRRDTNTRTDLQNQKLSNAVARIERLDAITEESLQTMQNEVTALRNEFHEAIDTVEYRMNTKTRDLSENITSISNKVSVIEKPSVTNVTDRNRIRNKVIHYSTDFCVSLVALFTMLLQVLIRCLNLGAVLTENRVLAIFLSMSVLACGLLVYISDPLITWLSDEPILDNATTVVSSHRWRDLIIGILSFFRGFSRGVS